MREIGSSHVNIMRFSPTAARRGAIELILGKFWYRNMTRPAEALAENVRHASHANGSQGDTRKFDTK